MSLRILHSIHSANPAGGGPIEGLKQMSLANIQAGHRIEVLSLDDPAAPWLRDFPLTVHALGPGRLGYGYSPRFVDWLRQRQDDYDAVVVNGIWQYNAFGVWRALHRSGKPYFVYTHGMLDPWFKKAYPLKHLKKWLYWPWGDYRVLRDAAAVLFTCEEERLLARQSFWLYRCAERVVKYGTPGPPAGDNEQRRQLFAARWPATEGRRCLLHLGRAHAKKGTDLVLQTFARHLAALPESARAAWHLIVAGPFDQAYGRSLQELATQLGLARHITWTGMLSGDLKWGAFLQSEAFILPSHQENFGIVVAESLACGRPVLISDKVNIWREIVSDGAGFVAADTLDGSASLLRQWCVLSPAERTAMAERALACFRARFSIQESADSFLRTITPFLGKA